MVKEKSSFNWRARVIAALILFPLLVGFTVLVQGEQGGVLIPDFWLAVIVSASTQILRWVGKWAGKPIDKAYAVWLFFLVSVIAVAVTVHPQLPALPDLGSGGDPFSIVGGILAYVAALGAVAGTIITEAYVVYKTLMQRIVFPLLKPLNF